MIYMAENMNSYVLACMLICPFSETIFRIENIQPFRTDRQNPLNEGDFPMWSILKIICSFPDFSRRDSSYDGIRGNTSGDHSASTNHGTNADFDTRHYYRINSDPYIIIYNNRMQAPTKISAIHIMCCCQN